MEASAGTGKVWGRGVKMGGEAEVRGLEESREGYPSTFNVTLCSSLPPPFLLALIV